MLDERLETRDESGSITSPTLCHPGVSRRRAIGSKTVCFQRESKNSAQRHLSLRWSLAIRYLATCCRSRVILFGETVAISCLILLSACTDYVSQIEDKIEERERMSLIESSDNSAPRTSTSVAKSSSSVKSSSSSEEKSSSSSVEEEKSSSSKKVCAVSPSVKNRNDSSQIVIRFMPSWTNTNAIMYVAGGDSALMKTVKNYCGWFEAKTYLPTKGFYVSFKQTVGAKITPVIPLDSVAALSDSLWVIENSNNELEVYACYPGILGDCPTKRLPVMMFDWLHGTRGDGDDEGKNGDPANGVSADFGSGGCGGSNAIDANGRGLMKGMVEDLLGANGVPVRAANFPENCKITTHLDNWFLPEVVAEKDGKQYTNATCRSIELQLQDDGLWLGQKDKNSPEGGLFLLDDFEYLDTAKTVANPYFDNISFSGKKHNYGFTMKIQAAFDYIPGQYFEFFGDDDVWVFINNRLVVDLGGQHAQVLGAVDLDTLGLTEGKNYPFHIFYAERHTSQSNFMMRTSIDLKSHDYENFCH